MKPRKLIKPCSTSQEPIISPERDRILEVPRLNLGPEADYPV
jgi:hypothetical protein